ncbi:hypothetical protein LCGC14_0586950 [marine sediment metagenome]|uniref:Uncharacterized protein n=1 Tax=marine sediment metagenome TaxID=412755 RepID=A0A0F9UMY9_9ZZZZ|nr:hypothetical protein [archaeon]HEC36998.1 hypothetical protein [bacterium]
MLLFNDKTIFLKINKKLYELVDQKEEIFKLRLEEKSLIGKIEEILDGISLDTLRKENYTRLEEISKDILSLELSIYPSIRLFKIWVILFNMEIILLENHINLIEDSNKEFDFELLLQKIKKLIGLQEQIASLEDERIKRLLNKKTNNLEYFYTENSRIKKTPEEYYSKIITEILKKVSYNKVNSFRALFDTERYNDFFKDFTHRLKDIAIRQNSNAYNYWIGYKLNLELNNLKEISEDYQKTKNTLILRAKPIIEYLSELDRGLFYIENIKELSNHIEKYGLPIPEVKTLIDFLIQHSIVLSVQDDFEIGIPALKCFFHLLDYNSNSGEYMRHIGNSLENIVKNFAKVYDVNINCNIPLNKTELDVIINNEKMAYIIECKLIENPTHKNLINQLSKFEKKIEIIKYTPETIGLKDQKIIPIFFSIYTVFAEYNGILIINNFKLLMDFFLINFKIKKLAKTRIDYKVIEIFNNINQDRRIDLSEIDESIPENIYRYDVIFVLDIDKRLHEVLSQSYFIPFPFIIDINEEIRCEFYDNVSNGETIKVLLYNAFKNNLWSKIELIAFK